MSFSVNVRSIEALSGFRLGLLRYRGEAEETLEGVDYFLARQLEWFDDRIGHWQREVRRCREDARAAELALARFRAASINPEIPPHLRPSGVADRYQTAVARCYQRLRDAEGHLASTKQWRKMLDQALEAFRSEQHRFTDVLQENLPAALTMLEHKLAALAGYVSVPLPAEPQRPLGAVAWPAAPHEDEAPEAGEGDGHAEAVPA